MPPTLNRTRSVLERRGGTTSITFVRPDSEPSDGSDRIVTIDAETWRDLGEPERITVTIEPGDLLND